MRQGLSLKLVIGGSISFLIIALVVAYVRILSSYTQYGTDFILSYMMEEETQYFSERHARDPSTPLPKSAFFTGVIGREALPASVRTLLESSPLRVVGSVQIYEDTTRTEGTAYLQSQLLADGTTLYLFEGRSDMEQYDALFLSEEYFENKMQGLFFVGLSVPVIALLLIAVLVWLVVSPLQRLTLWTTTLGSPIANPAARPGFSYKELNILAASLADSVQRVKAASVREERLLRYCSHEMRTPLAIAKANMQLLAVNETLSAPLQRIQRSVQKMQGITETLLWMSRERYTAPILEAVDMHQVFKELMEDHGYLARSRELQLVVDLKEGTYLLPLQACRIIFGNLLRNVLQYADEGCIEMSCTPQQLSVINRIGSLRHPQDCAEYGYGLGLELVKQLCERLDWQVRLSQDADCFSVVIVFAPQQ